eukprot:34474-Chlamydomonas_euryale.AAC.1
MTFFLSKDIKSRNVATAPACALTLVQRSWARCPPFSLRSTLKQPCKPPSCPVFLTPGLALNRGGCGCDCKCSAAVASLLQH